MKAETPRQDRIIRDDPDETQPHLSFAGLPRKWFVLAAIVFISHFLYVSQTMQVMNLSNLRNSVSVRSSGSLVPAVTITQDEDAPTIPKGSKEDVWKKEDNSEGENNEDATSTDKNVTTTITSQPESSTNEDQQQQQGNDATAKDEEEDEEAAPPQETEELLKANFHGRFWLKDHSSPPWQWFMVNVTKSTNFPFVTGYENGAQQQQHQTCLNKPFRAPSDPFKNFYDPQLRKPANPHYTTCQLPEQARCPNDIQIPMFHFKAQRKPYTLADAANLLAKRKTSGPVRVTFIGDSTTEDMYNWAKCHMSMLTKVRTVPNSARLLKLPNGDHPLTEVRWFRTVSYVFPTLPSGEERKLVISLARVDRVAFAPLAKALCENNDLIAINIGLHHRTAAPFRDALKLTLQGFREHCPQKQTILVYVNHPAQHFAESDKGEYVGPSGKHCAPHGNNIQASDWRSTELLQSILPDLELELVPPPWEAINNKKACFKSIFQQRRTQVSLPLDAEQPPKPMFSKATMHYVPFFDISASLWNWHLARFNVGMGPHAAKIVRDCTHLLYVPSFGVPIWDALFFAVLKETSGQGPFQTRKDSLCLSMPQSQYGSWTGTGDEHEKEERARRNAIDTITETWKLAPSTGDNTETAVATYLTIVRETKP